MSLRTVGAWLTLGVFASCAPAPDRAPRGRPPSHASSLPADVAAACDSAAALARRTPDRTVALVRDTVGDAPPGDAAPPACAVLVELPATAAGAAVFRAGFPGRSWRVNLFEHTAPENAFALWTPTVFCDVAREGGATGGRARQLVSIVCEAQTPADTPRVVQ